MSVVNGFVPRRMISISQTNDNIIKRRQQRVLATPEGLCWFVKTEQFSKPFPEVKPHLEAHYGN